ncbi:uncharacterized protein JN550_005244 [Neoarthrinium moseri]|uniref:uncharacterized protein n=1 Tax=Neoarthrinium moseri TaxID=1658444 RepID=UPI001FDBAE29|nr:uncharacterized protein JN550_005244 [Neoarthrinium moseri]KAI1870316.1 hypothetical protein JN550_005244 [Neoarthrinium moseri]
MWQWMLENLGLGATAQQADKVKTRTKAVDDGWLHVSLPRPIPEFEDVRSEGGDEAQRSRGQSRKRRSLGPKGI